MTSASQNVVGLLLTVTLPAPDDAGIVHFKECC